MAFIMSDEGELYTLQKIQVAAILDAKKLRLFSNNITPSSASVFGDFDEATFSGYAENAAVAFAAAAEVANKAQMTDAAARVFTHDAGAGSQTIYGYYYCDSSVSKLILAERFAAPVVMANNGDNVSIQITLKLNGV